MNTKIVLSVVLRRAMSLMTIGIMLAGIVPARAEDDTAKRAVETAYHADIVARLNPDGIMLIMGGFRRWSGPLDQEYGVPSSYNQLGVTFGVNPAYAQAAAYGEWKPVLFAQARLQYDLCRFFGENGALLSFPSADSKFGKHEIDALSGQEQAGWGQRLMLQPVMTAKAGSIIIRNTTVLAYYRFGGRGPYFLEWEYDTLLKDRDYLIDNLTAFLVEAWRGPGSALLLAGPFYEVTHSARADLTRQRAGAQLFWSPAESIGSISHPRVYGQLGVNLQDRNRDNETFLTAGLGFDF